MILDASCRISYSATAPIPAIMMLRPRSGAAQWIAREEYAFTPHAPVVEYTDGFGNLCQRVLVPEGHFEVHCSCRVHTADVVDVDTPQLSSRCTSFPKARSNFFYPAAIASRTC